MDTSRRLIWGLYTLLFVTLLVLVPRAGFDGDTGYWVQWATYSFEHGFGNLYVLQTNMYNPLYHYLLYVYAHLMGSPEKIAYYHNYIKGLVLLFDFGGAIMAASLVPADRQRRFTLSLLLLLNVAYLYNTLVWEQIDALYSVLVFGAVVLALRQRLAWSAVAYVLALNAKAQAIQFLPPLLLLWLPLWWRVGTTALRAIGAALVAQFLVVAPFIWGGQESGLPRLIELNTHPSFGLENTISMHAYNLWVLLLGEKAWGPDTAIYASLDYHTWGLLMFLVASAVVLLPLLLLAVGRVLRADPAPACSSGHYESLVLLSFALIPLVSTYFNTRMHERYWHSSILFLAAYGLVARHYWPYIAVSVAYFLNLEEVLRFLNLRNYKVLVFQPEFVAVLFTTCIALCIWRLYKTSPIQAEWRTIRQRFAPAAAP